MTTTRAETTHTAKPALSWGLSMVNSIKGRARRHKEKLPLVKVLILVGILALMGGIYVKYVNQASTFGYFYKIESQKLDDIQFEYNLVKLDVLEYRQRLWHQSTNFDAWSDPAALRDRLIIVTVGEQAGVPSEVHEDTTEDIIIEGEALPHSEE